MADGVKTGIILPLHILARVGEEGEPIEIGTVDFEVPMVFTASNVHIDQRELHARIVKALRSIE